MAPTPPQPANDEAVAPEIKYALSLQAESVRNCWRRQASSEGRSRRQSLLEQEQRKASNRDNAEKEVTPRSKQPNAEPEATGSTNVGKIYQGIFVHLQRMKESQQPQPKRQPKYGDKIYEGIFKHMQKDSAKEPQQPKPEGLPGFEGPPKYLRTPSQGIFKHLQAEPAKEPSFGGPPRYVPASAGPSVTEMQQVSAIDAKSRGSSTDAPEASADLKQCHVVFTTDLDTKIEPAVSPGFKEVSAMKETQQTERDGEGVHYDKESLLRNLYRSEEENQKVNEKCRALWFEQQEAAKQAAEEIQEFRNFMVHHTKDKAIAIAVNKTLASSHAKALDEYTLEAMSAKTKCAELEQKLCELSCSHSDVHTELTAFQEDAERYKTERAVTEQLKTECAALQQMNEAVLCGHAKMLDDHSQATKSQMDSMKETFSMHEEEMLEIALSAKDQEMQRILKEHILLKESLIAKQKESQEALAAKDQEFREVIARKEKAAEVLRIELAKKDKEFQEIIQVVLAEKDKEDQAILQNSLAAKTKETNKMLQAKDKEVQEIRSQLAAALSEGAQQPPTRAADTGSTTSMHQAHQQSNLYLTMPVPAASPQDPQASSSAVPTSRSGGDDSSNQRRPASAGRLGNFTPPAPVVNRAVGNFLLSGQPAPVIVAHRLRTGKSGATTPPRTMPPKADGYSSPSRYAPHQGFLPMTRPRSPAAFVTPRREEIVRRMNSLMNVSVNSGTSIGVVSTPQKGLYPFKSTVQTALPLGRSNSSPTLSTLSKVAQDLGKGPLPAKSEK